MARRRISAARNRSGHCPKCGSRVFELPAAYVCEKCRRARRRPATSVPGASILQRPIERAADAESCWRRGKTDLLQFVSSRTRRRLRGVPGAAAGRQDRLRVRGRRMPRGQRRARPSAARPRCACSARIPKDKQPVELHAGRYGPVRQARRASTPTLPRHRTRVDAVTLIVEAVGARGLKARHSPGRRPSETTAADRAAKPAQASRGKPRGASETDASVPRERADAALLRSIAEADALRAAAAPRLS